MSPESSDPVSALHPSPPPGELFLLFAKHLAFTFIRPRVMTTEILVSLTGLGGSLLRVELLMVTLTFLFPMFITVSDRQEHVKAHDNFFPAS